MLFAQMVVQQTNMAMIFLGKTPHPQTGKTHQDLDAARLFIDQLEMLEVKTKGNLSKDEEALLKQSLSHLRLAYVEIANQKGKPEAPKPADTPAPESSAAEPAPPQTAESEDEPRKRFTKKY
jgi:hypothetical protein